MYEFDLIDYANPQATTTRIVYKKGFQSGFIETVRILFN